MFPGLALSTLFFSGSDAKLYKFPKNIVAFLFTPNVLEPPWKRHRDPAVEPQHIPWHSLGRSGGCILLQASEGDSWVWEDGVVRDCDTPARHSYWSYSYLADDRLSYYKPNYAFSEEGNKELWFLSKEKY